MNVTLFRRRGIVPSRCGTPILARLSATWSAISEESPACSTAVTLWSAGPRTSSSGFGMCTLEAVCVCSAVNQSLPSRSFTTQRHANTLTQTSSKHIHTNHSHLHNNNNTPLPDSSAGHEELVRCVRFNENFIVSGSYDTTVRVWDFKSGFLLHTLRGHTNRVFRVQFDAYKIVSSSQDDRIMIWNFHRPDQQSLLEE
eukprot:m.36311 g.36311  ORF g.36311 m.36311 type:complete len:198 (+) comp13401_c0_seq1:1668-2261(+)